MKAHFAETGIEFFFHRYLIDSKKLNPDKRRKLQNQDEMSLSTTDFRNNKTSLHKCRSVQVGQENLQEWPLYLLKRVAYIVQKKQKKGKSYQVFDQNIKKVSQIRTEYLCYQIMNKSHRVVRMIELINQNAKKQDDQKFFYKFLGRKRQSGIRNACFILELCNDGNLQDRINNFITPLTQDSIILYCCQILQGLVQLKKKGILHRDLRPCNIFLHNNQVKFGDFDSAFIYKESQCSDIKSGIDINTTPQQIVQLASLSDEQLEAIGNLKLYDFQTKCDIYFFGMIIFKMVFKREYEKKFEGTDIEYLIREKIKEGFTSPKILEVMKNCLYTNVEKRIDLVTLYQDMKVVEKERYFANEEKQRTYLSEDPLNLFSYRTLEPTEPQIMTEIQNSVSHTFTLSFVSIEYNFQADFQKASLNRATKLYADQVHRVHSKYYKTHSNPNLWSQSNKSRKQLDQFLHLMQSFVIQMSTRAYFYDYLYKSILKINTKSIPKKQQKSIVTQNKDMMQKQLIIILKFLFQILSRTPFKIDKYYCERNLPYETRRLFKDKIKINNKYNFFEGRAKTFDYEEFDTYKMIKQFFNIDYDEVDGESFETVYQNVMYMIDNIDKRLKQLLSQSIVDLFRPFDSSKKSKNSHLKQILFIMITLEKQKLSGMKKSDIVMMKQLLEPLFNGASSLDLQQAQMFFDNYKNIHEKQVEQSKKKQNIHLSFNLLAVSKKHLDCIFSFMSPFAGQHQQKPVLQSEQPIEEQEQFEEKSSKKSIKKATHRMQYSYEVPQAYGQNQNIQRHESPKKQQIQVKVFEEQRDFSEFDQNMEASNYPIKT